ncbi:hypothetical protein IWX90DRAFT_291826 [Phyllosticta citrichinensis]|uniref:Uncharacterized protein n=1 Tax=Phyllosticta citrichinensis TaxID=1130410 RepID=A0ABR1XKK2_9PEZI
MDQALKQKNDVVSLNDLSADHVESLKSTVARILATPVARQTFAQIVDGLPLYEDRREYPPPATHPLVDGRRDVCPEASQAMDTFRDNFSLDMLHFDTKVCKESRILSVIQFDKGTRSHSLPRPPTQVLDGI